MNARGPFAQAVRTVAMVGAAVFVLSLVFRVAGAGSLTPVVLPASTMQSVEEVYTLLVGTFDSSGVVASKQGGAMEVSKCIISAITGGAGCP
jgi:hypothetical protein